MQEYFEVQGRTYTKTKNKKLMHTLNDKWETVKTNVFVRLSLLPLLTYSQHLDNILYI